MGEWLECVMCRHVSRYTPAWRVVVAVCTPATLPGHLLSGAHLAGWLAVHHPGVQLGWEVGRVQQVEVSVIPALHSETCASDTETDSDTLATVETDTDMFEELSDS